MQLKDVTPIIKAILEERDKVPRIIDKERYIPNPQPYHDGNFMRGGLRKALRIIEQSPVVDAVKVVRCKECWKRGNERECPMCHEEFDGCDYCTIDYTSDDGFCHMGKKVAKDMDVPTKDGGADNV